MNFLKVLSLSILIFSMPAFAGKEYKDWNNSSDHPLISRYPNTHIISYSQSEYDEFELAIGKNDEEKRYPPVKKLEGKSTTIIYEANNANITPLQIISNYKNALKQSGFKEIFNCKEKGCGEDFKYDYYRNSPQNNNYSSFTSSSSDKKFQFYSGSLERNGKNIYVSVGTYKAYSNFNTMAVVDIFETIPMEKDLIKANPGFSSNEGNNSSNKEYKDWNNSSDHPMLSRYPNSHIISYSQSEYDEFELAIGKNIEEKAYPPVKKLEGKITTIIYETNNTSISPLQIITNYKEALGKAGFTEIFNCKEALCGKDFKYDYYRNSPQNDNYSSFTSSSSDNKFHFYSASLTDNDKTIYTSVGTYKYSSGFATMTVVDIVEIVPMVKDLIKTNDFSSLFKSHGKATLSGILFDTNKATIKPESEKAIEEINKFLTENSKINVFIVGHTDNTHTYEYNLELSQKRADAVVNALVTKGIDKSRMKAIGVGPASPVSTNSTKEGKATNRRVEMVLMAN